MQVLIVGGGLAGLVCARHLHTNGIDVTILEASDDIGGRVRSDYVDGFTLDRGFQVLFDQYPAARHNLDLATLDLMPFEPGAIICQNGQRTVLTDPLRDRRWRDVVEAARSPSAELADKARTLRLALTSRDTESDQRSEPDDQSTAAYLRELGFSDRIIDTFFRPFYGGIFLERELTTTAALFRFYFRMLSTGNTTLPSDGIGAITQQLAGPLRGADRIRVNAPVAALLEEHGHVVGVRLESGEELRADAVVLATDAESALRLAPAAAGLTLPEGAVGTTAIYFAGTEALYSSAKIVLNAAPDAFVNNAQLLSNVAPSYAPEGRHLLGVTILGVPDMDDRQLVAAAVADLRAMFAGNQRALGALAGYYPLKVYRVRYAQFPQPPGVYRSLPANGTLLPGLYSAAEWTDASSINGAMTSGERCAATINNERRASERAAG